MVLGPPGLLSYLKEAGYEVIYPPSMGKSIKTFEDFNDFEVESDIQAVVTAYDANFDYFAALYCCACLQNGANFIGMSLEGSFICGTSILPGSGNTLKFIETATGKRPYVVGKPMPFLFDIIVENII